MHFNMCSQDGDRFFRMAEVYIRGNTIKYVRVPDEVVDKVKEEQQNRKGVVVGGGDVAPSNSLMMSAVGCAAGQRCFIIRACSCLPTHEKTS